MKAFQQNRLRKGLITVAWVAVACAGLLLLVAAMHKKEAKLCNGTDIEIRGLNNNFFIDEADVLQVIRNHTGGEIKGKPVDAFNLVNIEKALKKEMWINKAELYFDNNAILHANITEREPLARIFTIGGESCYIDQTGMMLPLSEKLSARVPIFTNFPSESKVLTAVDSSLLKDVKEIALYIQKDSFLYAMIDQVVINSQRQFELVPKMGDQLIVFGEATEIPEKFNKLKLFYKKVMPAVGWGRYHTICLQYTGQVVAKIRGKEDIKADSLQTLHIMQTTAAYAAKMAADTMQSMTPDNEKNSTQISLIMESLQRDEAEENGVAALPLVDPKPAIPSKPAVVVPVHKKPAVTKPAVKASDNPAEKKRESDLEAAKPKQSVTKPLTNKPEKLKNTMPAKPKNDY
jgi:cell division protein FtsQ